MWRSADKLFHSRPRTTGALVERADCCSGPTYCIDTPNRAIVPTWCLPYPGKRGAIDWLERPWLVLRRLPVVSREARASVFQLVPGVEEWVGETLRRRPAPTRRTSTRSAPR